MTRRYQGRDQQGQHGQAHPQQAIPQGRRGKDDGQGLCRHARCRQQRRVEEGPHLSHQLRQPAPQGQPAHQPGPTHQQSLHQVHNHHLQPRRPPAAQYGNFRLAPPDHQPGDQRHKVEDQADDRDAQDGKHHRQKARRLAVRRQRLDGRDVEAGVGQQGCSP